MALFPILDNLAAHKDASVADIWDSNSEGGGWSPRFPRSFTDWEVEEVGRFLCFIPRRRVHPYVKDKMLRG